MVSNDRYSITATNLDPERVEAEGRIAFPSLDDQQLSCVRNSRPFRWIDVEADETYENLLEAFRIRPEDTPAVFLSKFASQVHILIRSSDLEHSMSRYLINRIEALPNVILYKHTQISHFEGNGRLERIRVQREEDQAPEVFPVRHVFVFIGAAPNTDWLHGEVSLDGRGFVCTGPDIPLEDLEIMEWESDRRPFIFETNRPGVFAAGDVRSGSTKRVASAVGEGSVIVQFVHKVMGGTL